MVLTDEATGLVESLSKLGQSDTQALHCRCCCVPDMHVVHRLLTRGSMVRQPVSTLYLLPWTNLVQQALSGWPTSPVGGRICIQGTIGQSLVRP